MRTFGRILIGLLALILVAGVGFTAWAYTPLGPLPQAGAALQSDESIRVTASPWLTFAPIGEQPTTGFIFYPGGRVDPKSYAPAARAIAAQGYLVIIVPVPFNLAVFDPSAATTVITAHPEILRWALGGHSLGGAMAANFVYAHPGAVEGLVLWAAYPARNNSLADRAIAVTSISASEDGLATGDKIEASRALLPADARLMVIQGGNHAQFGAYGVQPGDGSATIGPADQQAQTVAATVELLASLSS